MEAEAGVEGGEEFLRRLEDTVEERLKSVKCFFKQGENKCTEFNTLCFLASGVRTRVPGTEVVAVAISVYCR